MKNKNYPKYVQAMHLLDAGQSNHKVSNELHIGEKHLKQLRQRYLKGGELALLNPEYTPRLNAEEKYRCIAEVVNKELSLSQASLKHDKPHDTLRVWYNAYLRDGMQGLEPKRKSMAKKKALRQLTANASQKIRRNVLKLKIAVQKADYDASVTEYERMKEVFDKLFANE